MSKDKLKIYMEYIEKAGSRIDIYRALKGEFKIKSVLYPGSYVHLTPSLLFPKVYFLDSDKRAKKFFSHDDDILNYLNAYKEYKENPALVFIFGDYQSPFDVPPDSVDLLISEYAGFVSRHTKQYLKIGGILLAGDSHGDATLANSDPDFLFLGVLRNKDGQYQFYNKDNISYFKRYRNKDVDINNVIKTMKGPKYYNSADYYIFQKQGRNDG